MINKVGREIPDELLTEGKRFFKESIIEIIMSTRRLHQP